MKKVIRKIKNTEELKKLKDILENEFTKEVEYDFEITLTSESENVINDVIEKIEEKLVEKGLSYNEAFCKFEDGKDFETDEYYIYIRDRDELKGRLRSVEIVLESFDEKSEIKISYLSFVVYCDYQLKEDDIRMTRKIFETEDVKELKEFLKVYHDLI